MEKREPSYTTGRDVNWYSHYGEQYGGSLQNWKQSSNMIQQSYSLAYIWKKKNHLKTYMHPSVHWSTIYNSQDREPTSVTTERWMDKEDVLYLHNGIVLSSQWKQCQTLFLGAPKSVQMVIAAVKLKDAYSLEGKLWPTWIAYLKAETLLCQQRSV